MEFLRFGNHIIKASLIVAAHGSSDGTSIIFTNDNEVHRVNIPIDEVYAILNQQWVETTTLGSPIRTYVPVGVETKQYGPGLADEHRDSGDEQRD